MTIRSYKNQYPQRGERTYIDESAMIVGDVSLGPDVSIWPLVAARGDVNSIKVGARTNIQDGSVLHVTRKTTTNPDGFPLIIGEDVTIGHKVMLHGCRLGNRILVGMGAIVMDNAVINDDVIIGAGSLVPPNKVLESGYLYVGSPVKQARPLNDDEKQFLRVSADNYVRLKNEYITEVSTVSTPDLCDAHKQLRIAQPVFKHFGMKTAFYGEVVTVRCDEDNSKVKELVAQPGEGKVLVVDGGGSLNKALLGDMLCEQAVTNGWQGFVINGCIRDAEIINRLTIGVRALNTIPVKTEKRDQGDINQRVSFAGIDFSAGDYLYADQNGIVVSSTRLI